MGNDSEYKITIYEPGYMTTNYEMVDIYSKGFPLSFRKAQDVLVATKKYVKKSGLFSTETKRIQRMQGQCYELVDALKQDGFFDDEMKKKGKTFAVIAFFNMISETFPNWQEEYETLNRFVPMFFEGMKTKPT